MAKREQKEGSIRQHTNGIWEARVAAGMSNGKLIQKSLYGKTKVEVLAKKIELLNNLNKA